MVCPAGGFLFLGYAINSPSAAILPRTLGEISMQITAEKRLASGALHSDYFSSLDALRESGVMNMFGAPSWLQDNFDLNRNEARAVFVSWTESFQGGDE